MTAPRQSRSSGQTAAILLWVGIAAGVVFIVAVVFFSGFLIGRHSGAVALSRLVAECVACVLKRAEART